MMLLVWFKYLGLFVGVEEMVVRLMGGFYRGGDGGGFMSVKGCDWCCFFLVLFNV